MNNLTGMIRQLYKPAEASLFDKENKHVLCLPHDSSSCHIYVPKTKRVHHVFEYHSDLLNVMRNWDWDKSYDGGGD